MVEMLNDLDDLTHEVMRETHLPAQRALNAFKDAFGSDETLLSACLRIRMAHTGAADPIPYHQREAMIRALDLRLATWYPSQNPGRARFDAAVRELIEATLAEVRG